MKKILITGASGGFGSAACRLFLEKGWQVWGIDLAEKTHIPDLHFYPADLTDPQSLAHAFETISRETEHLDVILHTAGIYDLDSLVEISEESLQRIFQVNFFGAVRVNRLFLPLLHPGARIILTTSELAPLDPLPFTGIYAITKSALEKYADSLRMELQLLQIDVSVLRPGAIRTNLLHDSTAALTRFCENTRLYSCNAARFRRIVDSVEAKNVAPAQVAAKAYRAATARRPRYAYCINRNPLLLLMHILPKPMQTRLIGLILRP